MHEAFPLPLVLVAGKFTGKRWWTLEKPFQYVSSRGTITIPQGFTTDLASIPRVFWNLLSPTDEFLQAAICHDYLYSSHLYDKATSDLIFLEAMEASGVGWFKRKIIYRAVWMFGGSAYSGKAV
jgi:hypothetical protein